MVVAMNLPALLRTVVALCGTVAFAGIQAIIFKEENQKLVQGYVLFK